MFYVVLYKKKRYNFHFFSYCLHFLVYMQLFIVWFIYPRKIILSSGFSEYDFSMVNRYIYIFWNIIHVSATKFIKNITTATVQKNNSDMNYWEKKTTDTSALMFLTFLVKTSTVPETFYFPTWTVSERWANDEWTLNARRVNGVWTQNGIWWTICERWTVSERRTRAERKRER